ncbi:MAG: hypothetical protein AAFR38_09690 [Planctomycetota bacterium]
MHRHTDSVPVLSWAASLALPLGAASAQPVVTVFEEDFESPTGINLRGDMDVTQQTVASIYGATFNQTFTVETLAINGPQNTFSDPSGMGGNYSIGLLSDAQNDLFAFTFNVADRDFVNVFFDLSSIDLPGLGGPFTQDGVSVPELSVMLLDTPGGVFNIGSPGSFGVLGSGTATGVASPRFEFDWTSHQFFFNATGSTDGNVTLLFDLTAGGYASLDNFLIESNEVPSPAGVAAFGLAGLVASGRRR